MNEGILELLDLASERLGGAVVDANDEFFAAKDNLIKPGPAQWREGEYTDRGKWMDGWETRRRRNVADDDFDWCIIRLGVPGVLRGVDVDTSHFKGNYPTACAVDISTGDAWFEILGRTALAGDRQNIHSVNRALVGTHVRLRIYPDGGVARFRAYGTVAVNWDRLRLRGDVDLAAAEHGGMVVGCSDMFFGSRHSLIMPGDALNMGDGWETRRRRGPGHDWTVIRLGSLGTVRRVEVDTRHFKGNAPESFSLEGSIDGASWREILSQTCLLPHMRQSFEEDVHPIGDVSHVRLNIFPDGGIARLRLFGRPA